MEYTKEELLEAKRQIDSTLHKLRATIQLNYYGIDEKNIRRAINDLFHLNYAIT